MPSESTRLRFRKTQNCAARVARPNEEQAMLNDVLDVLTSLPVGWDGYQGKPVDPRAAKMALEIAEALPGYSWQAVPGDSGDVQLEYHGCGFDIEINIAVFNAELNGAR